MTARIRPDDRAASPGIHDLVHLGAPLLVLLEAAGCSDRSVDSGAPPAVDEWAMLGQNLSSTYHNRAEKILSPENVVGLR